MATKKIETKTATKRGKTGAKETKTVKKTVTRSKMSPTDKLINAEKKRLISFLKNKAIDEDKLNIALDLINDISYMTVKTPELKKDVDKYGVVEEYQNGANQKGLKISSPFKAYLDMTKQKSALIKQVIDLLPAEENYKPTTPIDCRDDFDKFLEVRGRKNE